MIAQLDTIDSKLLNREQKRILKSQLLAGGKIAEEASKKIMEILTQKRAGEPYLHKDLGWVQEDKDGKIEVLKENQKDYNGSPLGTSEIGTPEATLVLNSHGISTVPKGVKYLDNNPIIIDKKVQGTHIIFKDKYGDEIESADSTKDQNAEYISAEAYREQNPDWVIPDNTLNVSRDKNKKILGYQIKDPQTGAISYLAEHDKSWQQAKALHSMLGTQNLDKKGFLAKFPNLTAPPLATRIAVDKDNNITFFDKDGVEVKGQSLSRVNLVDVSGNSDDIISYHIDDKTGRIINRIGKAKIERTPVERLRYNQERADKLVKERNLNAMIDALGEDYNVDKRTLDFYRKGVAGDYDKTFDDVTAHYGDFVSLDEAVVTGDILNKRIVKAGGKGDVYDNTLSYAKKAGVWEQYTPSSDWIVSGETGLRKEFNRITNDYRIASRGHDGVMEGLDSDNGFGDIMAITSFRIMFEPNSVVREAEFEITSQAGGWFQTLMNKPHQFMVGDRLQPDVRKKMRSLVVRYMKSREDYVDRHYNDFRAIAQKNFKSNAGIEHPFKSYKWSKHYDKKVKVNASSTAEQKEQGLDELGKIPD
jgi:hypothetical protein